MSRDRIQQLRSMILVHSCIYYRFDRNLITDAKFDAICKELVEIGYQEIGWYDETFEDFDGSTGYHLPADAWVMNKAIQLMRSCNIDTTWRA